MGQLMMGQPLQGVLQHNSFTWIGAVADGYGIAAGYENFVQTFKDGNDIADYARGYVACFAGRNVVNGMGDGRFAPQGTMTREQAIKVALMTVSLN